MHSEAGYAVAIVEAALLEQRRLVEAEAFGEANLSLSVQRTRIRRVWWPCSGSWVKQSFTMGN